MNRFKILSSYSDPIDWVFTWSTLQFSMLASKNGTNFKDNNFFVFRYKLLFDELPTMNILSQRRPDLYPPTLKCFNCTSFEETNLHVWSCDGLPSTISRLMKFKDILNLSRDSLFTRLSSIWKTNHPNDIPLSNRDFLRLPCWSTVLSSSSYTGYDLLRGFVSRSLVEFVHNITYSQILTHSLINKLVFKLQDRSYQHIWLPRCNDMQQWEFSIGLTRKLKLSPRPSTLSSSSNSRIQTIARQGVSVTYDRSNRWISNSITCGLKWFNHLQDFLSRLTVRLFEHTVVVSF